MFLNDFSQRKLSSLLRPWLIEEPELQVKLGFLRSHAVAKNLRFDTSVFNHLIGDTLLVSFKHVTIEELDIRIAPWSAPAFTVQVRGVNVTLCAEERVRGRASRVVEESIDGSLECKKNILAKIDPQGSALHESLEKVIVNASSRNSLKTSIVNAILRHIWLYMHDIRLRVDLPVSDDPFAFLWDVMEINVACKTLHGCFLGSIVGSFIRPLRESPFDIDVKRLEIRTERKEHAVCIFSSTEPYIAIRLKDHHLVDLMLCVPEMKISLSPDEVAMILALGCLVPVEPKQHRNGVQLWKLARSKIGNFLSPSGYMLYKTFNIAVLCLRLAKAYEHFLLLVGYPADETLQKTIIEISEAANFSIPFKQQLGVISEIEKHLPAEAIAWARRVGRHGAKLKTHCGEDSIISCSNSHFKFLQAIFLLLVAFWRTICKIFKIVVTSLSWKELSPEVVKGQVGIISEGSTAHFRLSLNVGKLSVLIYPLNAVSNLVAKRSNSNSRISYSDLLSFCLFFEGFLFIYEGGILEQNLSFSLGCLKVTSAPVLVDSENANSLRRDSSSFKEQKKGSMDDLDTIVCGDSAPIFSRSGISETGSLHFSGSTAIPFMDKFLGEMRPMWKRLYSRFQESETLYTGNPCLLCEFKVLKVCHGLDSPDFGFWKCNLTVGQLNFAFGYTSVLSIACLIMQMQRAICLPDSSPHGLVLSKSSGAFQELPDMSWHRRFKASAKKMRMAMFNLFPDRHIELGAVIAGPLVQLSLRNNESSGSTLEMNSAALLGFNLTFIFNNICLAVWPTLDSGHPRYLDIDVEFFTLVEPKRTDISESTIETHVSKRKVSLGLYLSIDGLDAYFEDSEGNRRIQILELKPVTIKLSALRAYLHSFGTTEAAFSAALHCVMQELSVSFCTDELYVIFQVVGSILSAAPTYAFGNFGLDPGRGCQASAKHGMLRMKPKTEIIVDYTEGGTLNLSSDLFIITSSFKLDSVHVILHNSRKSNGKESSLIHFAADSCKKMGLSELPGNGVWLSVQRTCLEISCEGQKAEVHTDFSVSQAVIFRHKNQIGELTDHLEVVNVVPKFFDCLSEASFSGCTFTLVLDCPMDNSSSGVSFVADTGRSSDNAESLMVNSTSASKNGRVTEFTEEWSSESNTLALGLGHWLLMSISLNMIFVGSCLVKNFLFHAHQPNRLQLLLSVSEECQRIVFGLQDGFLFVETAVLVAFARYWTFYLHFMRNLVHVSSSLEQDTEVAEPGDSMSILGNHHVKESGEWKLNSDCQVNHKMLEALTVNLSQLFLVFLAVDESGRVQEIIWKVDFCLNLGLQDGKRKFLLNLHQLKILSQVLDEKLEHTANEVQAPHFSFASSSSLKLVQEDLQEVQNMERAHPQFNNASCSSSADSARKSGVKGPVYEVFQASDQHYILKELAVSVSAEKHVQGYRNDHSHLRQGWAGKGSGSGFDMIISLPEIQMLMAMLESLSEVFGKEASNGLQSRIQPSVNQETVNISVAAVHDGAIVAICDVHQHLYITVECLAGKYSLAGGIHYSLVGERALFKIEYQKKRRWHFADSWFSLVSLYAKSDTGEPMRLTYCSGSGFVHISSTKHGASVLWKIVSCKAESYEGDTNMEPFNMLSKSTFYLVNKNSDCGIAFINGVPEFVRKPGSPFKFKIFGDSYLACDIGTSETDPVEADGSNLKHLDVQGCCSEAEVIPCINLRIDKANFTIVHELSGQKEVSPLLKGCISNIEVLVQVLCCKTRVISTFTAAVNYFDSHRMQWRELIRPLETCVFYRSRLHCQEAQTIHDGVPISCHLRMEELDILVTEISLDILLYVVGKLDLAGPFAVKSSSILANCCKVENQLDLNILCQFYDAQTGRVGRKQSVSFFLRHIMDQALESLYVSIKLDNLGTLSTTPIYLPLSETRAFAWRMRIMSLQDQRTYPGPFVVFDISKNNEEGVSIAVTPLLRVHNATVFPMELRFQRPQQTAAESASVLLKPGDIIDDCMAAFDAVNLSGSLKKALMSLSVGNFLLSFRPEIEGDMNSRIKSCSVEWSDNLKGGKAVHLSGLMDKLAYKVRNAFSAESRKYSFSTTCCSVRSGDKHVGNMHFLVQSIGRKIPILKPNDDSESKNSFVAMQEQKEVFLLPTVRVTNLLQSDIHVLFSETDICPPEFFYSIGNQATVPSGSAAELYANPAIIFFTVNLVAFNSSCKPVNGADLMKKLNKQKDDSVQFLDIDLEFCGGKYFACLRLTRGDRGILEAVIFTSYTLRNDTDLPLLCSVQNQKPLSRDEAERSGSTISPNLGSYLPPRSMISWFMKSKKLCLKLLDEGASQALLDLDALSGLAEISLNIDGGSGFKHLVKLGVSLGPLTSKMVVPSRIVSVVPRYVVSNESDAEIYIRQCFVEDDLESIVGINSKQKRTLVLQDGHNMKKDITVFDKFLRKHRIVSDDSSTFVQFRTNDTGLGWSGPVCVASLGRFFLKFKRSLGSPVDISNSVSRAYCTSWEFAVVHVVEETSSFVLRFQRPPDIVLPYRIENHLNNASITFYQKDTFEPESLAAESSVDFVWDDLTRPHKLVVRINGFHLLREINLDKLRPWKPFSKARQQSELAYNLPMDAGIGGGRRSNFGQSNDLDIAKVGYEVCADGPTRVLRICFSYTSHRAEAISESCTKIRLRVSSFSVHLLEHMKQDLSNTTDASFLSIYAPIIVGRLENISLNSIFIDQQKYYQIRIQSINIDQKWVGAPFAAMLRRHQLPDSATEDNTLFIAFVLNSTSSNVRQVKYSSLLLQPIDLNLDEETLMKIVPFWRTSLSKSTRSQQYYFDHFEIHPVKIMACFLPAESYSSYSSAQETLRSLLHSVIKIPVIKNVVVELNGVLVTHALITARELMVKCAQHYSWYVMRAIYIAKGSPLLPPTFASVFDDLASSSLDVFFDPSSSLLNVQGLTLGTFKLIKKCIERKGFSGTKRYFGDLGKTLKTAGSNILFTAVTEISDSVLKGAESSGFSGMVIGFHQGILKLAMEPSLLGTAFMEGGPDRKIKLDRSPGVDELYIEGYLQAMLDTTYKQEYLRVRVIDNQVILKNLPPNSALIDEIMDRVKDFLVSKALLKGDSSTTSHPLRHLRGEHEWRIGPTVLTLCEHLFVSFAIRMLRKQASNVAAKFKLKEKLFGNHESDTSKSSGSSREEPKRKLVWQWGIGKFVMSALVAYIDGRLCRGIPNPVARRIVSGFLLSFLDRNDAK